MKRPGDAERDAWRVPRWLPAGPSLIATLVSAMACSRGVYSLGLGPLAVIAQGGDTAASGTGGIGGIGDAGSGGSAGSGLASNAGGGAGKVGVDCTGPLPRAVLTSLLSAASDGTLGDQSSSRPAISADGRFVVFSSSASNIVPSDSNGVADVFASDLTSHLTIRVNLGPNGEQANSASMAPTISPDGTRIGFASPDSNLVPGATDHWIAIVTSPFTDLTGLVPGPALTAISPLGAQGDSIALALANAGSRIIYRFSASNLAPTDSNGRDDLFLWQPASAAAERLVTGADDPGFVLNGVPRLSGDGTLLVYSGTPSGAPQNVYALELGTRITSTLGVTAQGDPSSGACYSPSVSADGRRVAFACDAADIVSGDTNGVADVFVRDMSSGVTERASVASDGHEFDQASSSPTLSGDGRWLAFQRGDLAGVPHYSGLIIHDLECGLDESVNVGTALGTLGSDVPFEELAFDYDGSALVATVTGANNQVSQIVALTLTRSSP